MATPNIGDPVIYVDPRGNERPALVTSTFSGGEEAEDGCNVVFVNDDDHQHDTYGRKIERATSVCHQSVQPAHGNYWKRP